MLEELLDIDRKITLFINGSQNLLWDYTILTATSTWIWIPVGLVILSILWKRLPRRDWLLLVGCITLGVIISEQLSSTFFKPYFQRWRPAQDPIWMYAVDVVNGYRGGRYGFFSSHASNTLTVAMFLTLTLRRKWLGILIISWSLLNCYTRLYLGVHYMGDILVGLSWGALIGFLMYKLFCKYSTTSIFPNSIISDKDGEIISTALILSYCMVIVIGAFRL